MLCFRMKTAFFLFDLAERMQGESSARLFELSYTVSVTLTERSSGGRFMSRAKGRSAASSGSRFFFLPLPNNSELLIIFFCLCFCRTAVQRDCGGPLRLPFKLGQELGVGLREAASLWSPRPQSRQPADLQLATLWPLLGEGARRPAGGRHTYGRRSPAAGERPTAAESEGSPLVGDERSLRGIARGFLKSRRTE